MEIQDHKKPNQSGLEGSSGSVHICHKCGWPFPKPHPSAKHRRAHKRVCGTIDGYKLDNDAQNKSLSMEGSDGEHVSDDEQKTPGLEGSSGSVHICHKCGWPIPKPHPSAKHRRAHKRVCGTIDGYKLDNDAQNKSLSMEGSDGEHVSDDEQKTPGGKVVETVISRRSNSGVGSRSSRSTRSEDEVYTDAVTDFTDTPSPGEASDGIQRFYSMQRVTQNDLDDIKHAAEKAEADNLCAPSILLNDNQDQAQPVQKVEGENDRVEAGVLSQDHIPSSSSGPALASASITFEIENEGETASEIVLSKQKSELRTSYNETTEEASEDVSVSRDVDEEILVPVSAGGIAKSVMETTGSENNIKCSQAVEHPLEVIDPANGSSTKLSDVDHGSKSGANADVYVLAVPDGLPLPEHSEIAVEDLDHKRRKFNTLMAPGSGTETESVVYGECGIAHAAEEVYSGIDLTKTSDSKEVYSEDDVLESVDAMENKLNQDVGHKSISEQNPVCEEPVQLPDVEASDGDISEFRSEVVSDFKTENLEDKISCAEEQKPIVALNNVFPEGASSVAVDTPEFTSNEATNTIKSVNNNIEHVVLQEICDSEVSGSLLLASDVDISEFRSELVSDFKTEHLEEKKISCAEEQKPIVALNNVFPESASSVAADNPEFTSNGASNTSNGVKNNTKHVVLQDIDGSEVSGNLLLAEHAINDIPPQFKELSNIHGSSDTGNDVNIGVVQTHLDGSEIRNGGEDNAAVNAETAPGCGSSTAGYCYGIHEPFEVDRFHDQVKSDKLVDSGGVLVGEDGPGAILKTDNLPGSISKMISTDASEVCDDAQCSLQSSATVNHTCTKKFAEEASGVVDGDRIVKPHIALSGSDVLPDSSSQTDSLEGNWGSVSVMSAVSDTPPANDTPASNQSQASAAKDNASLELKPMMESQNSESKTPVEPHIGIGTIEGVSEIQTLEEQKEKGSALQTSWSSSVAHVDNAPHGGKRNEEIIAKVTNWSTEKQHMPLKTLLGEATARSREESPIHTKMKTQTDEPTVANNDFSKTENVILSLKNPTSEASKEEMGKEWNSPARYPVNIKTEKRKGKSRPYWAPFLCCSSVNASC